MRGKRTNSNVVKAIQCLYREFTPKELAELFGLPLRTVYDVTRRAKESERDFFPWSEVPDLQPCHIEPCQTADGVCSCQDTLSEALEVVRRIEHQIDEVTKLVLSNLSPPRSLWGQNVQPDFRLQL